MEMLTEHEFDPRGCVVWGYPPNTTFGLPLPLTIEAADTLADLGYDNDERWTNIVLLVR
jgi:hypothetical protein